jgi:hypothetical protein
VLVRPDCGAADWTPGGIAFAAPRLGVLGRFAPSERTPLLWDARTSDHTRIHRLLFQELLPGVMSL